MADGVSDMRVYEPRGEGLGAFLRSVSACFDLLAMVGLWQCLLARS